MACVLNSGWLLQATPDQEQVLSQALAGFYQLGGVDLVREQIEACFEPQSFPYDITEGCLVVWPGGGYKQEIVYKLDQRPTMTPRPRTAARTLGCPPLLAADLLFNLRTIRWDQWVE